MSSGSTRFTRRQPSIIDLSSDSDTSSKDAVTTGCDLPRAVVQLDCLENKVTNKRIDKGSGVSQSSKRTSSSTLRHSPNTRSSRRRRIVPTECRGSPQTNAVAASTDIDAKRSESCRQTSLESFIKTGEQKSTAEKHQASNGISSPVVSRKRTLKDTHSASDEEQTVIPRKSKTADDPENTDVSSGIGDSAAPDCSASGSDQLANILDNICTVLQPRLAESEMKIIIKLRKHFNLTVSIVSGITSFDFGVMKAAEKCLKKLNSEPDRCFTLVRILLDDLDRIRLAAKSHTKVSAGQSTKQSPSKMSNITLPSSQGDDKPISLKEKEISKLERTLRQLEREIVRFDSEEVDFQHDSCSAYIIASRLKRRYVQVYKLYCHTVGEQEQANRVVSRRRIRFDATRYPEVNRCLEKFVNRTGEFPDYNDVLEQIRCANNSFSLHLSEESLQELAGQAFGVLGAHLQRRRRRELVESMDSLSSGVDWRQKDPAYEDPNLNKILSANASECESRINEVLERYTRLQHSSNIGSSGASGDDSSSRSDITDDDADHYGKGANEVLFSEQKSHLPSSGSEIMKTKDLPHSNGDAFDLKEGSDILVESVMGGVEMSGHLSADKEGQNDERHVGKSESENAEFSESLDLFTEPPIQTPSEKSPSGIVNSSVEIISDPAESSAKMLDSESLNDDT